MELRQFTYVDMVATCGSFTKAAAKLFISQPMKGKSDEEILRERKNQVWSEGFFHTLSLFW